MIDPTALHSELQAALDQSIACQSTLPSNASRSGYFCSEAGRRLHSLAGKGTLLQIGFDEKKRSFESGEWMLDGAVVEFADGIVKRIHIALECESSTALKEFKKDFGKLLNIRAQTKIYLHGLDHATVKAADKLAASRIALAAQLVKECDPESDWFFGFWPSPKKTGTFSSLWDDLHAPVRFAHLSRLRLFRFNGDYFVPVAPADNPPAARAITSSAAGILAPSPAS